MKWSSIAALGVMLTAAVFNGCGGGGSGPPPPPPPPPTYSVHGIVTSAITGSPVAGVQVSVAGTADTGQPFNTLVTTDSSGSYLATGLPNGMYAVVPTLSGASFYLAIASITISGGNLDGQNFLAIEGKTVASGLSLLPTVHVSNLVRHASIAISGNDLVFSDLSNSPLKKLSLLDGSITPLANLYFPAEGVTRYGSRTYWVAQGTLNVSDADGNVSVLAQALRSTTSPGTPEVVVDNAYAYWVHNVDPSPCTPSCTWVIDRVPLNGGSTVTLVTASRRISALASDASNIYWEEAMLEPLSPGCQCGSSIKSIPKSGGTTTVIVDGTLNGALPPPGPGYVSGSWLPMGGLALTDTQIVFGFAGAPYTMYAVSKAGGSVTALASISVDPLKISGRISAIKLNGSNAYWIDENTVTLYSVPVAGGALSLIASGLSTNPVAGLNFSIAGTTAYYTDPGPASGCCATSDSGRIRSVSLSGGTISTVLDGLNQPAVITTDGSEIYFGEAWRMGHVAQAGGSAKTVTSGIQSTMGLVAADQLNAYVMEGDSLKSVPLAGGVVVQLAAVSGQATGVPSGTAVASNGSTVFWTTYGASGVGLQAVASSGGPTTTLFAPLAVGTASCTPRVIADASTVYWSSGSAVFTTGCALRRTSLASGITDTLFDDASLMDFTLDASNLYVARLSAANAEVDRIPISGGSPVVMALGGGAVMLVNNDSHVFGMDAKGTFIEIPKNISSPGSGWQGPAAGVGSDPQVETDDFAVGPGGLLYATQSQANRIGVAE